MSNVIKINRCFLKNYKAYGGISYNPYTLTPVVKICGGEVLSQIDITERELEGKKIFSDYKGIAVSAKIETTEETLKKYFTNTYH